MEELFRYFNIINKHSNVYLDNVLAPFGLCSCHRVFIHRIYENPGITRDRLKNIVHIHPSNTTRTIDYLASTGYIIKKVNDDDKRICELYPDKKLEEVYNVLVKAEKDWIDIITLGISDKDLEKYNELLKISANLSINYIHKK